MTRGNSMLKAPSSMPTDKVKFVAEVSSNHNQDLDRCFAFIDKSAEIGCDAVKFQLFKIEELFAPEILLKSEEHRKRKAWELPLSFLPKLATRCKEKNIKFGCTPFYLNAVDELYQYLDFYKIASYELLWNDLLAACAKTGKPVVISTGMATLDEVKSAVDVLITAKCKDLTILHCVSGYPTPITECNLAAIETLRALLCSLPQAPSSMHQVASVLRPAPSSKLHAPCFSVGWSDHSVSPGVIYRAVHYWHASMIEFHLDLDGTGEEYKTGHCWLPEQIKTVIESIRTGFQCDGTGKKAPAPSELSDRDWRADPADGLRPVLKTRVEWRRQ
jgi:N-acetylneuraminate synthase